MGEHKFNPVAQAHAQGKQMVRALDIGEGCALVGTQLIPRLDGEELVVMLAAIGGKDSPIVGFEPKPVVLKEIARVPLLALRTALAGGAGGPTAVADGDARKPATDASTPDSSLLAVVP